MPFTSTPARLRAWLTSQRNLTIFTAITIAIPVAYTFHDTFGADSGDFLLLFTLAVGVPTAFDEYWDPFDRTWKAIGWVGVACSLVTVLFTALYVAGTMAGLSSFDSGVGAFLVTALGGLLVLGWLRSG